MGSIGGSEYPKGKDYSICTARCATSAEKATTDLAWRLYPLTFFEMYQYGSLVPESLCTN